MKINPNFKQLRMLASVKGQQWLIREDHLQAFAMEALDLESRLEALDVSIEDFYNLRQPLSMTPEGVAIIHIQGALLDQSPPIYEKLGMVTRYATITDELRTAEQSGATAVMFVINSPGGTVAGNIEAASAINQTRLPTMGYCSGLACSAAYKLGAGMDNLVASPSAQVGNIGTILSWADCSEFWANMGIEFKALTSEGADLKSTFHLEPNETQLAFLQESIDEAGQQFRDWVQSNRMVDEEVFRAGWYSGDKALDLGLVDAVASYDESLVRLTLANQRQP